LREWKSEVERRLTEVEVMLKKCWEEVV